MSVQITEWDCKIERGKHVSGLILGSRNTGKTYLMTSLLLYKLRNKYDLFLVFATNLDTRNNYVELLDTPHSYDSWRPEIVQGVMAKNEERKSKGQRPIHTCIIVDDTVSRKLVHDDTLLQAYCTGRHFGISLFFLAQSQVLASTVWRNNADLIAIFRQNGAKARQDIIDKVLSGSLYLPGASTKEERQIYNEILQEYASKKGDCLVIDRTRDEEQALYKYRAPQ